MQHPRTDNGDALGAGEEQGRFDPPLSAEEQQQRDAERERVWDAIKGSSRG